MLVEPEIDLLVNVSVDVSVTTPPSVAIVNVLPDIDVVTPDPPATTKVSPKLISSVVEESSLIVILELAILAFVIPALPDNIELVIFDNVLLEALIVLFVSVVDTSFIAASIWDRVALPSVPPSDTINWSEASNVCEVKLVAVSILIIASTAPNSSAVAPEFTFNTWPADPIDNATPVPPWSKPTVSPVWNSANPVATLLSLKTVRIGFLFAIILSLIYLLKLK